MTLTGREPIVDRPELVDRGTDGDQEDTETENGEVLETLGEGDGPTINNITFEEGDYGVVAASNLTAILSTSQTEGVEYETAFATAAIQIKEMAARGVDIAPLVQMSRARGVDDINVSRAELNELQLSATEQVSEKEEGPDEDSVGEVQDEDTVDIEAEEEEDGDEGDEEEVEDGDTEEDGR